MNLLLGMRKEDVTFLIWIGMVMSGMAIFQNGDEKTDKYWQRILSAQF